MKTLCQVCESAPANHQCRRCGALVCRAHYEEETGLCTDCAASIDDTSAGGFVRLRLVGDVVEPLRGRCRIKVV